MKKSVPTNQTRAELRKLPVRPHLDLVGETVVTVPEGDRVAESHRASRVSKVPVEDPGRTRRARTAWKSR
jgi:hypothetical protein